MKVLTNIVNFGRKIVNRYTKTFCTIFFKICPVCATVDGRIAVEELFYKRLLAFFHLAHYLLGGNRRYIVGLLIHYYIEKTTLTAAGAVQFSKTGLL